MRMHGEPIIERFGTKPQLMGYSAMQFIETSSITAHFAEIEGQVFIDIFSCKTFNPIACFEFCKQYFGAEDGKYHVIERG
jgi:S-adenosylmethionine/arginine decarboxylase-like enzyme